MAGRHRYTSDQLNQYFDRISLPTRHRTLNISNLSSPDKLTYLNLLQKHQLAKVPWVNLTQHYSWHRTINVHPAHLFTKIVLFPGRGGYCMEANHFFHTVLLSLGFDVYMAGARIHRGEGMYGGWTHVVNLVTIDGTKYLLDGGFGPQGPSRPLAVREGEVGIQVAPAEMRVVSEAIPQMLDRTQRVWVYQHRYEEGKEWVPMYCFTELEFIETDIVAMNFAPWLNPQTFFTHKVVAVRFTTDREPDECPGSPGEEALEGEIDGSLTLNQSVLKWRRRGRKVVEVQFLNDEERQNALEQYFGIVLAEEDRQAIKGTAAEVGGKGMGND
ncbi:hypothetical protein LTR35_009753 [Friedmanniomyces endolithicus]|uniref:Arylamine N-acetyltransferase n=1 Tax=Friedmanniomyces endolithicus TaxID=329885 RepID=A0AAN6J8L2_9PEZI|nr:hypothetical protein LTR35_009753 [Friedmanniomyces endolithicus]KAK0301043.1 hypothetical protein LTS00_000191 [Friedmanniomyces endolithicus]KAK0321369.1 hypothetical protein LTR82_007822 [Friedmanniomyces endolithicus]KAK1018880.1 hypothetical protein LTR54_000692 [Friedmanniomyces endolithicus]